jgi:UDP-N-acetylmuramate dehydrogenase
VGGPAEFFFTTHSSQEIVTALKLANKHNLKVHILGGGSNVVISDTGLKGLTIRSQLTGFEVIHPPEISAIKSEVSPRLITLTDKANYKADELKPSFDQNTPTEYIKVGSGWKMNALVQKCLQENLTGLEWFSGIPGSVGGGIYMNMHGGNFFWSDFVEEVATITQDGETKTYSNQELEFDYDYSLLHKTKDIILSATLKVYAGDVTQAKKIFTYWAQLVACIKISPQNKHSKPDSNPPQLATSSIRSWDSKATKLAAPRYPKNTLHLSKTLAPLQLKTSRS